MIDRVENKSKILTTLLAIYFFATPVDYILPHFGEATVLLVVGLLISAFAVFFALGHEKAEIKGDQTTILFLALFMVASNFWAQDTTVSLSYTFSFVATAAMYFLLFFFRFSKKEIELFETAAIIGGAVFMIYVFTKVDMSAVMAGYRLDLSSVGNDEYFSDPNGLAARLMMPVVFAFKRVLENGKKGYKILCAGLAGIMVYIIFLTGSRAAVITLLAIFFVIVFSLGSRRVGTIFAFCLIAGVILLLVPDLLPEHIISRIFNFEKYAEVTTREGDRIDIWKNVLLNVFPQSPVWGHGAGNASIVLEDYYGKIKAVHSSWFTMLADLGLIGFTLWMSFVFGKLKQAIFARKESIYVLAVLVGVIIMASTLDSVKEKYLWNGFLYVHLITTMYVSEETSTKKIKR